MDPLNLILFMLLFALLGVLYGSVGKIAAVRQSFGLFIVAAMIFSLVAASCGGISMNAEVPSRILALTLFGASLLGAYGAWRLINPRSAPAGGAC